ncbi:MAG: alanine:cation symporter family protein, partial [Proteobacteria bacterium]|nr:alanine:cation symporter family protein [Pseudomonadota bacterium]
LDSPPGIAADEAGWRIEDTPLSGDVWQAGETVVLIVSTGGRETGNRAVSTRVAENARGLVANWPPIESPTRPVIAENGLYRNYVGTTLTAKAFDTLVPGLGKWFLTIAAWLFAYSTIVTWSYYGEQGVVFIAGERAVRPYRLAYCLLPLIATLGWIQSDRDLDNLSGIGTAVMVIANLPILWLFGYQAIRAYREYFDRMKRT